ncbi:AAA family ATPase [uncultured Bifidobacterium sp.]|uniref:AAA family ATPase n=1 Tax=uncultured Bifidobacterium sp. TaxID=165187 RepID=UPI0028DCE161|nr:AAA family ATPase [uncultured Bifidobacterium sp.]
MKAVFPDYDYVNLEDPQMRRSAVEDPVGFIRSRPAHLIIDEAQNSPEIFSMIQVASDERRESGQYILCGSQNFLLMRSIGQSLAGRAGVLRLLSSVLCRSGVLCRVIGLVVCSGILRIIREGCTGGGSL